MTEIKEPKKTYRLSVDLSIRKKELLYRIIPWGQRNNLLVKVINLALVFFARHGFASAYDALENNEVEIRYKRNDRIVLDAVEEGIYPAGSLDALKKNGKD